MKLLLSNCGILASGEGGFEYIPRGFLGIDGKSIDYIGEKKPEGYERERDMTGTMLIPGLINAHTHTPMTLLRGVGSGLTLQEWLFDKIFPLEDRLTPEDVRAGSELALLEMLSTGTTSFTDMYMMPEETVEAVLGSGMKANICRPVQCFDENERPEDNLRIRQSLELFDRYNGAGEGRVLIDFCVHAEYTCKPRAVAYYADLLRERGGNLHIHMSETKKEHSECVERYGMTPAEWFDSLGAFGSDAFAAHCVWVTEGDMELMARRGVSAVHCPTSNMKLGSGFAPLRRMMDLGINVALGTDGAASNNNLNMLEELHLASVIHNGYACDPTAVKPAETVKMATVNGARVQRRADTGQLRVGMRADIAAIDTTAPHMTPNIDPLALLCYSAQGPDVRMTMVDGKILYEDGKFLTLDAERIISAARERALRLTGK